MVSSILSANSDHRHCRTWHGLRARNTSPEQLQESMNKWTSHRAEVDTDKEATVGYVRFRMKKWFAYESKKCSSYGGTVVELEFEHIASTLKWSKKLCMPAIIIISFNPSFLSFYQPRSDMLPPQELQLHVPSCPIPPTMLSLSTLPLYHRRRPRTKSGMPVSLSQARS